MLTYLVIITTVLVITQIIRVVQNAINLKRQNKALDAQLKQIDEITNEDLKMQKEANRLIVEYIKSKRVMGIEAELSPEEAKKMVSHLKTLKGGD